MLTALFTLVYVVVCVFLILVVLLQSGKRADIAGAFGGGGSQTAFGARGAATLLSRLTTISAILFMVLALVLSVRKTASESGRSVLDDVPAADEVTLPTVPIPDSPQLPSEPSSDAPTEPAPLTNPDGTTSGASETDPVPVGR